MNVFNNIISNFSFLIQDFVGFSINLSGIVEFFVHLFIAGGIFVIFYLVGEKVRKLLFKENKKYIFFVNIGLGYIVIGTGMGLLGAFSFLQSHFIWSYIISVILIALYPFKFSTSFRMHELLKFSKKWSDFAMWGVCLFTLIAILRLMTPEITEDAYHTDLPRHYLASGTTIHESRDPLHVIPYPQLAEMIYVIPIFLGDKEATRFIHFGFYILIIFLLFAIAKQKEYSFVKFAPLLFATAPIVIRYSPSQYVDFIAVFPFLLSIFLIEKDNSKKSLILSGILLGSVFAVKMWTLIYLPVFVIYMLIINRKSNLLIKINSLFIFLFSSIFVPLLWYIRSFFITGNPIYPIFSKLEYLESISTEPISSFSYIGINWNMFSYQNMIVYSPLFFLGVIFCLFSYRDIIMKLKQFPLFIFFILLILEQLIVKVDLGRYLLLWYTTATIIISAGVFLVLQKNILAKIVFISLYLVVFSYYLFNTIFILPYGFGWADRNEYLTRVLGRDNASYYDFDRLFDKWILKNDLVVTYGIFGFYYADFRYIDVNFIFSKNYRSLDMLIQKGATKLFIKGGDIEWFCSQMKIRSCKKNNFNLLSSYPKNAKKYYLYGISMLDK